MSSGEVHEHLLYKIEEDSILRLQQTAVEGFKVEHLIQLDHNNVVDIMYIVEGHIIDSNGLAFISKL